MCDKSYADPLITTAQALQLEHDRNKLGLVSQTHLVPVVGMTNSIPDYCHNIQRARKPKRQVQELESFHISFPKRKVCSVGTIEDGEIFIRVAAFKPYVFLALAIEHLQMYVEALQETLPVFIDLHYKEFCKSLFWMLTLVMRKAWRINGMFGVFTGNLPLPDFIVHPSEIWGALSVTEYPVSHKTSYGPVATGIYLRGQSIKQAHPSVRYFSTVCDHQVLYSGIVGYQLA